MPNTSHPQNLLQTYWRFTDASRPTADHKHGAAPTQAIPVARLRCWRSEGQARLAGIADGVLFGFTGLSLIDLSGGGQPMKREDGPAKRRRSRM
jgi:asparagine synthetase B (glutamine-hydrolysing)